MTNSYDVDHGLSQCPPGPLEPVEVAQQDDTLARTGNTARDQEMYVAGIRTGEENAKHNAAIRAGAGWLPIESAPKDGTMILLGREAIEDCDAISVPGFWQEGWEDSIDDMGCDSGFVDVHFQEFSGGRSFGAEAYRCAPNQPTHWMPLPTAPGISTVEDAQDENDVLSWLEVEIGALNCRYHGDPSYDHDAYWMRDRVLKLIEDARKAFCAPAAGDALDAARYRWLRDESLGVPDGMREIYVIQQRLPHTEGTDTELFDTALDAAVDAAIAAQRKGDA